MLNENGLPQEGIDFEFIETDDPEVNKRSRNPVIEIIGEDNIYHGVIVHYGKIEFHVDETPPKLAFDYAILEPGLHTKEELMQNSQFKNYLGDIIVSTIERMSEEQFHESRNNNPEGSSKT